MNFLVLLISFLSISSAIEFNCTFRMYGYYQLPSTYSCFAQSIKNEGDETLKKVYGNHLSGKTNAEVRLMEIRGKASLTFIPKGMEKFFPNITALHFPHNNISRLNSCDLKAFHQLTWFALESNPIEYIPGSFFSGNPKMKIILLDKNRIKHVGSGLLDNLQNLYYAHFGNNICINKVAASSSEINALIEALRTNCPDIEDETTINEVTTISTGSSTKASTCGDINEVVCNLQEQNQLLIENNLILYEKVDELIKKNKQITQKLEELSDENTKIKNILEEIMQGILNISSRP